MTSRSRVQRILTGVAILGLAVVTACDEDGVRPDPGAETREYAVVVNSVSASLSVFPVDAPDSVFTIGLNPEGTPVSAAVRGAVALVPLGAFPAIAVVDLHDRTVSRTIPVAAGSGPTGVAIVDDSLAFVSLSMRNEVVPVLYDRGAVLDPIATGTWPEAVLYSDGRVYVLNARFLLTTFEYEGPGTVTVVDPQALTVLATVQLGGLNPGAAATMGGSLWVLNRGNYFDVDGSLSRIDPAGLVEVDHTPGFGSGPGDMTIFDSHLAIASFAYGVALWAPGAGFTIAPAAGYRPVPEAAVSAVGTDAAGRLYVVDGQCSDPGRVYVVDDELEVVQTADVEVCPFDIAFTSF